MSLYSDARASHHKPKRGPFRPPPVPPPACSGSWRAAVSQEPLFRRSTTSWLACESVWDRSRLSGRPFWVPVKFIGCSCCSSASKGAKKHGFWHRGHFRGFL